MSTNTNPQAGNEPNSTTTQQPQAGGEATTNTQSQQTPTGAPQAGDPKTYDEAYVQQLRREAAENRVKRSEAEKKLKEFEDAQLSEAEKARKEASEAKAQLEQMQSQLKERTIRAEVGALAAKLRLADVDAAYQLMNRGGVEFDEQGAPKNIEALLTSLVKDKPFLVSQSGVTTSTTNPPRATALTKEQIARMSPDEINSRWDEVQRVLAEK
jgi:flagellar biosynthesis GTPase FlhF